VLRTGCANGFNLPSSAMGYDGLLHSNYSKYFRRLTHPTFYFNLKIKAISLTRTTESPYLLMLSPSSASTKALQLGNAFIWERAPMTIARSSRLASLSRSES
jgi:hypothetical protein